MQQSYGVSILKENGESQSHPWKITDGDLSSAQDDRRETDYLLIYLPTAAQDTKPTKPNIATTSTETISGH